MNAEPTHDFREQAEARIVALLLGEASPFEEAAVQDLLKQDAGLAAFHEEMKRVLSLVQAASVHSSEAKSAVTPPPQLSPERRQALLQKLEKPAAVPAAIVPFPFWRRHWFVPAAAAASVLGLLGLSLWFYQGNLRPRFKISQATGMLTNSLTGAPKNPFVSRYAYVAGEKPQPAKGSERGFSSPGKKLFYDAGGPQNAEVASRELGAFQTLGETSGDDARGRQSGAAQQLSRSLSSPSSAPAATLAPDPSAGSIFLPDGSRPSGDRMTERYFANPGGSAPSVATVTSSVDELSTFNADLNAAISVAAEDKQSADSAGRRIAGVVELFALKTADDKLANDKSAKTKSSPADASTSYGAFGRSSVAGPMVAAGGVSGGGGGFAGGGGIAGGVGGFGGRALDRSSSLADESGVQLEQAWDEKKPAAGYPLSAGALVVLPQGEAKQTRFNGYSSVSEMRRAEQSLGLESEAAQQRRPTGSQGLNRAGTDFGTFQESSDLESRVAQKDGIVDRLGRTATGTAVPATASQWGLITDNLVVGEGIQEAQKPQSPISTENGRISTLGDTPMLGKLFQKDGADTTPAVKMVPLKVELPKLAFIGTPMDIPLGKHIESPEETKAARDALFQSSMNKRGDAAAAGNLPGLKGVALVPAPARTELAMKLAEESGKVGKPAVIAPDQKAVSELGRTKERIVEQDIRARSLRVPPPTPQPEIETRNNAFSTFSLNVSDVSFRLTAASLEKGAMPDPASIRSEEFINAFDYRDPLPRGNARLSFAWERARYPFAHNREVVRLALRTAARGREPGRPLNLVVALDHSGSMERADRVAIVQEAMKVLAGQLQPQDRISVILFARTAQLWVDGLAGGKPQELLNRIRELNPQGGTNLEDALALAYQTALKHFQTNGNNRVVLMTDGAANLGNVDPSALQQTVETHRKKGIALDCFGIGWEGFNDDLLEVLARHGDGRYGFLNSVDVVKTDFANQLAGALQVAAADVKAQVEFNPKRVTTFRQIGYARHQLTKEQFRDNTVDAAEIGAAESGNALYVIQVNPQGEGPLGVMRVRFKVPATGEYQELSWDLPFQGRVTTLDQSAASLRLAASSAAFAEWLANSPYAAEVNLGALESHLNGVAETFAPDPRPQRLAWMIRQARSISGK